MMREIRQAAGLFLALLALAAQLTLASAVPVSVLSLADVTVLCQHSGNPDAPPAPAHQTPDCLLCFVCHGASGPAGLLTDAPMPPKPTAKSRIARAVMLPPATAPPFRLTSSARPRAPPILV